VSDAEAPRRAARPSDDETALRMQIAGELACGFAHHLNNVLASLYVACASLRESCADDADAKASIDLVEGAADQAREVVRALVGFARPSGAGPARLHLQQLVERAALLLRPALSAEVDLRTECPQEPVLWVAGDAHRLEHALLTVAMRCREALPSGGSLRIAVAPAPCADHAAEDDAGVVVRIESVGVAAAEAPAIRRTPAGDEATAHSI